MINLNAAKKLKELARNPVDLTEPHALPPDRIAKFSVQAAGLKLLFATQRITGEVIEALEELSKETSAVKKMCRMQAGEVMNFIEGYPSEDRSVLHTAMRDFWDFPNTSETAMEATELARVENKKLKTFMEQLDPRFTDLIMIGIGGSDLGPRAIYYALQKWKKPDRNVHFISNVDPDDAAMALCGVDLSKSLVVVVSKSGTTLETHANEELVKARFQQAGLDPKDHFIAVTAAGSPMDDPQKYLAAFHIWDAIGGRYSVTSMVGGVMLSFALGWDAWWEFLRGANAMDKIATKADVQENLPLLLALLGIWNRNFLNLPTVAIIPYSQALWRFPAHLQQCDMESNGKRIDQNGTPVRFETAPIVWGEPGTNGQHSFFQLLHQGTATVPIEFIGFQESQFDEDIEVQGTTSQEKLLANLFAQAIAFATGHKDNHPNKLFPGNRPSSMLLAKRLNPYTMGTLLATYEHKIAFQGFIWNINSFDQEGVQLGKVLAKQIIDHFKGDTPFSVAEAMLKELSTVHEVHSVHQVH